MRLTILIPYYKNSEECEIYFQKLMRTLDRQIGGNIDLIVYEDGQYSTWLEEYKSRIYHIVNERNEGIALARQYLLSFTGGADYIMFLDSDDMIDCDFISKMYTVASSDKYDMIVSRLIINGREKFFSRRCNVAGICLRKDFIEGISFDSRYNISEDTLFIQEVYKRDPRIYTIDSNYYYNYGVNPNSLMKRFERSELRLTKDE